MEILFQNINQHKYYVIFYIQKNYGFKINNKNKNKNTFLNKLAIKSKKLINKNRTTKKSENLTSDSDS